VSHAKTDTDWHCIWHKHVRDSLTENSLLVGGKVFRKYEVARILAKEGTGHFTCVGRYDYSHDGQSFSWRYRFRGQQTNWQALPESVYRKIKEWATRDASNSAGGSKAAEEAKA
jgi:hypothetical protein